MSRRTSRTAVAVSATKGGAGFFVGGFAFAFAFAFVKFASASGGGPSASLSLSSAR